jgi:coenzyme PQQ synthesis protein D (PqqD)
MDDNKNGVYWAVSPHARATIGVDGGVLLDIEKGLCYSLNLVGAKIWLAIESGDGQATFEQIVNVLGPQFTVPRDQLVRDIDEYLRDLEKKGLIKAAGRV